MRRWFKRDHIYAINIRHVGNSTARVSHVIPVSYKADNLTGYWKTWMKFQKINSEVNTVECRYNVHLMTTLHTALPWQQHIMNQTWNTQETPHTFPYAMGCLPWGYLIKWTVLWWALHCILLRGWSISCKITHRYISLNLMDDKSTMFK